MNPLLNRKMKRIIYTLGIFLVFAGLVSCEKLFMAPNPGTDNVSVYDEYWKLLDEKYAMWENPDKNLNKDSIHQVTRAMVNNEISRDSLMRVLGVIVRYLTDGHTWVEDLSKPGSYAEYPFYEGVPENLDQDIVDTYYLGNDFRMAGEGDGALRYTLLENNTVGYVETREWSFTVSESELDEMIDYFKDAKGVIFDIRGNGGGDPFLSTQVARHFVTEEIYFGIERFKTGPGPDDFSPSEQRILPATGKIFDKKVMVLTNILCFSATNTFIYSLRYRPDVKFIGQRTGGGSGSTADNFLANGFHWQMSISEFIDKDGRHYDNGMDPDIFVSLDTTVVTKDEIIERAIQEIVN